MDPTNPIIKLCAEGMQAEFTGKPEAARALFSRAWDTAQDDFEKCVAAHYLARHQPSPAEMLRWNQESLARAEAVADERVREFYPSLYLNLGYSYETLGDYAEARRYYDLAATRLADLPEGPYSEVVRGGVAAGLERVAHLSSSS
jgi:tetratricopeptide (TPR) repeat protein